MSEYDDEDEPHPFSVVVDWFFDHFHQIVFCIALAIMLLSGYLTFAPLGEAIPEPLWWFNRLFGGSLFALSLYILVGFAVEWYKDRHKE
jgi:hypothetical protein